MNKFLIPEDTCLELVFELKNDNPPQNFVNNWLKFKEICECGQSKNKNIVKKWLSYCNIPTVENMPYLNRCEGGFGGNNNQTNKQIRFRDNHYFYKDNIIVFYVFNCKNEQWSYNELNDLINGFIKCANNYLEADCVIGYIKIKPTNSEDEE